MDSPTIVSGAIATVSELGKDEAWLGGWLKERPTRLGLGELDVTDGDEGDDTRSFAATDDERCFSVDVQLGEIEPSRGFGVLDNWARNRVRHPDKTHVAVLVTEEMGERYQTTLEALAQHLPIVVVELQVWRGENEAIVVPHIALASDEIDLSDTPAARAAEAVARNTAPETAEVTDAAGEAPETRDANEAAEATAEVADESAEMQPEGETEGGDRQDGDEPEVVVPENKDDTGVTDPWGPPPDGETADGDTGDGSRHRLLSKIGS